MLVSNWFGKRAGKAAAALGISKAKLWRRLKRYGVVRPEFEKPEVDDEIELIAPESGVTEDELRGVVGQISAPELARRAGYSTSTARRRINEAAELLKLPPGHWD